MPNKAEFSKITLGEILNLFWDLLTNWQSGPIVVICMLFCFKDILRIFGNIFLRIAFSEVRERL